MKKFLFFAFLLLIIFIGIYIAFLPILSKTAQIEANKAAQKIYTKAVNDATVKSEIDLTSLLKEQSGDINGFSADMNKVNLWKEYFIEEIEKNIKNKKYTAKIPIGTLLGTAFTYAKGPDINIKILLGGYINADVKTKIESAGINQSKYSIYVVVSSKMFAYLPFEKSEFENETEIYLAEFITVGEVPSVYRY